MTHLSLHRFQVVIKYFAIYNDNIVYHKPEENNIYSNNQVYSHNEKIIVSFKLNITMDAHTAFFTGNDPVLLVFANKYLCGFIVGMFTSLKFSRSTKDTLWNSMTLTSFILSELTNIMKYGGVVLYNLVFTE